jgi:hypothetical protein
MKEVPDTAKKVIIGVLALVALIALIWGATLLIDFTQASKWAIFKIGQTVTQTPINAPWLNSVTQVVLGAPAPITVENLILFLAVFFMLLFSFGEILTLFTIFSDTTAWVIAACLALVAGVTNVINIISNFMAGAAGLGAIGVLIIILTAMASAVLMHLGIGGLAMKWRAMRQGEIEAYKSSAGASKVTSAIASMKKVEKAFKEGE